MVKRYTLSKKERRKVVAMIAELMGVSLNAKEVRVEYAEGEGRVLYLVDGVPALIGGLDNPLPHLKFVIKHFREITTPTVTVDAGAVRRILNGADVMAPGIVKVSEREFSAGDVLVITEEKREFPIAVGRALVPKGELLKAVEARRGRVIKNLHYIGDRLWRFGEELSG